MGFSAKVIDDDELNKLKKKNFNFSSKEVLILIEDTYPIDINSLPSELQNSHLSKKLQWGKSAKQKIIR